MGYQLHHRSPDWKGLRRIRRETTVRLNEEQSLNPGLIVCVDHMSNTAYEVWDNSNLDWNTLTAAVHEAVGDFFPYSFQVCATNAPDFYDFCKEFDVKGCAIGTLYTCIPANGPGQTGYIHQSCSVMYFTNQRDAVLARCMFYDT